MISGLVTQKFYSRMLGMPEWSGSSSSFISTATKTKKIFIQLRPMCPSEVLVAVFTGKKEDMDKIQRSYSLSEKNQKKKRDKKKAGLNLLFCLGKNI